MTMQLNTIQPAEGSNKLRLRRGRGISSGLGKTGGRGHKGQKARSGGKVAIGFEGGQMPLFQRLGKSGFNARVTATRAEVRLSEIEKLTEKEITLAVLKSANLVADQVTRVKIILSGELTRAVIIKDPAIVPTKGAKAAIEKVSGKVAAVETKQATGKVEEA